MGRTDTKTHGSIFLGLVAVQGPHGASLRHRSAPASCAASAIAQVLPMAWLVRKRRMPFVRVTKSDPQVKANGAWWLYRFQLARKDTHL